MTKCYQLKIPYVFKLRNMRTIKFVSWTVSHRGTTHILFDRSAIQHICLFDDYLFVPFHSMGEKALLLKQCFSYINLYEAVKSPSLVVQLKLKVFAD